MKPTTKAAMLGGVIALATSLLLSALIPRQAKAAGVGEAEQYKILSTEKFPAFPQLEQELNKLGADGWKVRTAMGSVLVLAK
jgi:hypothetical protein